jgi:integrase
MAIRLIDPREDKTPFYYGRGRYLGVRVNRSTGATKKRVARKIISGWEEKIERGEYRTTHEPVATAAPATFLAAAIAYMKAGGDKKHLSPIIEQTGEHSLRARSIEAIDQLTLDNGAAALYPDATAATRNRQFYTPVIAILRRAGVTRPFKRPIGWRGKKSTKFLEPEDAFALLLQCYAEDPEFGLFCELLCYTGMRLSEPLQAQLKDLNLRRAQLTLYNTKNGEQRVVHLPPNVVQAFREQPPRRSRHHSVRGRRWKKGEGGSSPVDAGVPFLERRPDARLFRFHVGGHLRDMLAAAMDRAGLSFPPREGGFHIFCHTYGTWMHRYGKLDSIGLTKTDRWKDPRSADRYVHTEPGEEALRANLLPRSLRGNSPQ